MCLCATSVAAQGYFQNDLMENVAVEEGRILSLKCVGSAGDGAALQWSNPREFTAFFNDEKVLKDQRYELTHYSEEELSITLSNVTLHDEGIYTCLHYSHPMRTKRVNVTVLAAPSTPELEIRVNNRQEKMKLSCFTRGSKPPPRITWILDNGIEVYGDTEHIVEHDGKKCNTTSTLTVRTFKHSSTAECVIHHEAFGSGTLTASFKFTDVLITVEEDGVDLSTVTTQLFLNQTESRYETSPSLVNVESTTKEWPGNNTQEETSNTGTTISVKGTLTTEAMTTSVHDNATESNKMSQTGGRKKSGILLIILVVFLIFTLLFIVHLFMVKLRKAHKNWKKENETSDQTVESNKSRSNNEETMGQDWNMQVTSHKPPIHYVNECSETVPENLREHVDPAKCEHLNHETETIL